MPVPALAVATLESALNRVIELDPTMTPRLSELQGRSVGLVVAGTDLALTLYPGPWGFYLRAGLDPAADAVIRGTPLALIRLGASDEATRELFAGEVRIDGDVRLGTRMRQLFTQLEIDWEEQLAGLLGDVVAHQLGRRLRELSAWRRRSGEALAADVGEYLNEESRTLPSRPETESFMAEVDVLRDDVERLAARLRRLREKRSPDGDA
jgi:ubiquinone biosynthesis protein UbiJ